MLDRSKVAGVLADLADGTVVVGIGINVNQSRDQLPLDAPTRPGSLRTVTGVAHDRAALVGSLLFRLERLYDGWRHGGLDGPLRRARRARLRARAPRHARRPAGHGRDDARDGRLEIAFDDGERQESRAAYSTLNADPWRCPFASWKWSAIASSTGSSCTSARSSR